MSDELDARIKVKEREEQEAFGNWLAAADELRKAKLKTEECKSVYRSIVEQLVDLTIQRANEHK